MQSGVFCTLAVTSASQAARKTVYDSDQVQHQHQNSNQQCSTGRAFIRCWHAGTCWSASASSQYCFHQAHPAYWVPLAHAGCPHEMLVGGPGCASHCAWHGMAWVSPLTFGLGCVPSPLSALDVNIITVYDGMHWGLLYCNTAVAGPFRRVIPWHALGDWSGSQSGLYCTGPIMPITQ